MNELVEGVLAVSARFAPDDGAGGIVDELALPVNVLAVRLHVELLQVRREAYLHTHTSPQDTYEALKVLRHTGATRAYDATTSP